MKDYYMRKSDKISLPYGMEDVIDMVDVFGLDFKAGNALKYIVRAGRKSEDKKDIISDLKKAIDYLERMKNTPVTHRDSPCIAPTMEDMIQITGALRLSRNRDTAMGYIISIFNLDFEDINRIRRIVDMAISALYDEITEIERGNVPESFLD